MSRPAPQWYNIGSGIAQKLTDRWNGRKPKPKKMSDRRITALLRSLLPLFEAYDDGSLANPWELLSALKSNFTNLAAIGLTLKDRVPAIVDHVNELTDMLKSTDYFKYDIDYPDSVDAFNNSRFKPLISELMIDMEVWLSEHHIVDIGTFG